MPKTKANIMTAFVCVDQCYWGDLPCRGGTIECLEALVLGLKLNSNGTLCWLRFHLVVIVHQSLADRPDCRKLNLVDGTMEVDRAKAIPGSARVNINRQIAAEA